MQEAGFSGFRLWPMLAATAGLVLAFAPLAAGAQAVTFRQADGRLDIQVDGQPAATYVWEDPQIPRPYFASLKAPDGTQVSRNHPPDPQVDAQNDDHAAFHPGMWLAFGDLGGADFWRNKARVRHAEFVCEPEAGDGVGQFEVRNVYETADAAPRAIAEECARYVFRVTDHGYLITCDSVFRPLDGEVAFGDQEEMGFGVRLATPLTVQHGNGRILNSAGGRDEAGTWGQAAQWCSGWGTVDGTHVGAVVMSSPGNFRSSWFHSRDYGLIVANPFGGKAMTGPTDAAVSPERTVVKQGETLGLGFALGLFSTKDNPVATIEALYSDYQGSLRSSRVSGMP